MWKKGVQTRAELLCVGEADLAEVVDLGLHVGVLVERELGGERESRRVVHRAPRERDAELGLVVDLLVDGAADLGAVVDVRVEREVAGLVADGEVAPGELRLGAVERRLRAQQPAEVAEHQRAVHNRSAQVQVHVRVEQELVVLVRGLQHAVLLTAQKQHNNNT